MPSNATNFLKGGETAGLIRAFDWSATELGHIEAWPQSLKTATALLLQSPVAIVMLWGEPGYMIYNDAYSVFAGERHPELLGSKVREGWGEVADYNDNIMKVVLGRGETISYRDRELALDRRGLGLEPAFVDVDYSPVLGDDGERAGVIAIVVETTERVLAERRAADEQARQLRLLEQVPGFVSVLTGPQHRFDYVNDAFVAISGDRPLLGLTIREAFPELVGQGFYELLDQVYGTGERYTARGTPIDLNGEPEPRYIDFIYEPIRDDAGAVTGIFVGGYDVSEVHRSAQALQRSEEQLRLATENAEIGLWDVDVVTDTLFWPPRVKAMFGVSAHVPVTMADFFAGLHPDDSERTGQAYARAADPAIRALYDVEYRTVGAEDGVVRWVAAKGRGVFDEAGACVRVIGTALDITERKAVEQRLHDLNADLERRVAERIQERGQTWEISPHLLSVIAMDNGRFVRVNPAWTTALGWSEAELTGELFATFLHPDDLETSAAQFRIVQSGQAVLNFENRYRHKDGGYRWLSWVAMPEVDRLYSTARDITEEKAAAAALAQAQEALRQSQKMEAVGQLTGGIAHDFNNLLTGITGSLEMLQTRVAQGRIDAIDRYIVAAQGAARRATALTQRLLAFSRRQTLDPKPTDLNRLIHDMEELIRRTVGPSVHIEVVGAGGLWATRIDQNQLENALLNLCINARDAMPEGGRITIETANKWLDERGASERDLDPGQYVSLCVSDTGSGMSAAVQARAFDPFFTTKPLGQGTGLGLSMIYGFVRQSGGQVRIYSEVGAGTTVCLYLPRDDATPLIPLAPRPGALEGRIGDGETVLVIDDEPTIRMLIAEILEEAGYSGIEASDGPAGLKILQSNAKIDLLITDVGLPGGMNGRQIADAARVLRPDLKVLFITGYAENAAVGGGHLDRGMEVLTKPFPVETLAQRIRRMIEG